MITNAVEVAILGESGSYHAKYWENRDVCISPNLISNAETPAAMSTVSQIRRGGKFGIFNNLECQLIQCESCFIGKWKCD